MKHAQYFRMIQKTLIFILFIMFSAHTPVNAGQLSIESHGELLYSTHCSACHSDTIHWRQNNLATDWNSLKDQVNRWQSYSGLAWTEADINDVTLYLNINFYNFLNTEPNNFSRSEKFDRIFRKP